MGLKLVTSDDAADKVLRLIVARVDSLPDRIRRDVLDQVETMFFAFRYIATRTEIAEDRIESALERLENNGYIRTDRGCYGHGVHVWLTAKTRPAA